MSTTFSENIKEIRNKLKMNQADFSKLIGTNQSTLSAYENGDRFPPYETLLCIAQKCHVSLDWLFGLDSIQNKVFKPESMSDILNLLFIIDENTNLSIYAHVEIVTDIDIATDMPLSCERINYELGFDHYLFNNIIQEWEKMRNIYRDGVIDNEVYSLWKEKTLKKWSDYETNCIPKLSVPEYNDKKLSFNECGLK